MSGLPPGTTRVLTPTAEAWGDSISSTQAALLSQHLRRWKVERSHSEHRGPFDGVRLTGADVFWLAGAALTQEIAGLSQENAEQRLREGMRDPEERDALILTQLHLEGAILTSAQLQGALLTGAHLEGADLDGADLTGAVLVQATFDRASRLNNAQFAGASLDQVAFDTANLAVLDWESVRVLGDEQWARQRWRQTVEISADGRAEPKRERKRQLVRARQFRAAGRAYRLLSVALRSQGLSSPSTRYQYRAAVMDRRAGFHEALGVLSTRKAYKSPSLLIHWLASLVLGLVAGYGVYHLWRLFLTYVVTVLGFSMLYYGLAHHGLRPPSSIRELLDAIALSVTTFHGRGLQSASILIQGSRMDSAAITEAVAGLVLEGLFIASFTRRILGS